MEKKELIDAFEDGARRFAAAVAGVPESAYDFLPKIADDWTIRQHIIHLVDCEANNFVRVKSCIAQPASDIFVVQELDWVKNLENRKESVGDYMALFALLRKIAAAFLRTVSDEDFANKYFVRTYEGETKRITIADSVEMYRNHVDFHIDYVNRILGEYAGK
jgi:hypothetical protein